MILNSKNIADYKKEIVMKSAKITYFLFAAGALADNGGTDAANIQQPSLLKSN